MKNIYVNDAETVFEPFWDSGESYPNHEKYSYLNNYEVTVRKDEIEKAENAWNGIKVTVAESTDYSVEMKRKIKLDITDFDRFIFAASVPKSVEFEVLCRIDGKMRDIIAAHGGRKEYEGEICGDEITEIAIRFKNTESGTASVLLSWLGLADSKRREESLKRKSVYDSEWEGCFCSDYEIAPAFDLLVKSDEIEELREKVSKEPFSCVMEKIRKFAESVENTVPEKLIGKYIDSHEARFARERDIDEERQPMWKIMESLAFVGLVDKNEKYLRLACRYALSASCCENWCESFVGNLSGTTWHHRSFKEGITSAACAKVLSCAGNLLTWHGRNIIYNAIIMKGIPRLDADIKTMDYIWHMNQGIVFSAFYIISLIALEKKYPRYAVRIEEAKKNLNEIWNNYILPDGGAGEGAGYWNYSAEYYLIAMYVLSVRENVRFEEFCKSGLDKSRTYAESMLSSAGDGINLLPLNDTKTDKSFDLIIAAFFARSGGAFWKDILKKTAKLRDNVMLAAEVLITAPKIDDENCEKKDKFIALPDTGCVFSRRGDTELMLVSGPVLFGHSHQDKGSFILEANGEGVFIDRGICEYGSADEARFQTAPWHNLLVPLKNRTETFQKNKEGFGGEILCAYEDDGLVIMGTDISKAWEECERCMRFIISPDPECFLIYDIAEYKDKETKSEFVLNTYGDIKKDGQKLTVISEKNNAEIVPLNYNPEEILFGEDGCDGIGKKVERLRLTISQEKILTALILGETEVRMIGDTVVYKQNKIKIENNKVTVNDKNFMLFN